MKKFRYRFNQVSGANSGSTAIEMAFILPIIMLLIFSLIEFGMIMYVNAVINNSIMQGSRLGMTGDSYNERQANPKKLVSRDSYIQSIIKNNLGPLYNAKNVSITAVSLGKLDSANYSDPWGKKTPTFVGAGSSGDIVRYEISYQWKVMSPLINALIGKRTCLKETTIKGKKVCSQWSDYSYNIKAKAVIKNENY